ncbi:MAG: PKD domain-containing protein [Bacteroidia bacterium]|nr:PKD domain-containing protein [Bacteroidia bacterium]
MRLRFLPFFLILWSPGWILAQTAANYAVQVSAVVNTNPPSITLNWVGDPASNTFQVSRKAVGATSWGFVVASLPGTATTWTDNNVNLGEAWEYRVFSSTAGYQSYGYAYCGIEVPVTEARGKVILVVDSTKLGSNSSELKRFEEDLIGDGWRLIRHRVNPADAVPSVKSLIVADYNADPAQVKAVILLGHVPVPYSGNIYPDGHPDHRGAWPADVYYGEINGNWSDFSVNESSASRPENRNIPGDGKFDQSTLPGNADLWVGRIDFANMPAFALSEVDLLRQYLNKDHAFRHHEFAPPEKAVIDDNFGAFSGEAFAANGWKNFGPLVHPSNVTSGDFRTSLNSSPHLWAYGCGGGTYTSAGGIGSSTDFATDSLLGVFSMIFGSYHGDWDAQNNFMRAALAAKGNILTCAWAGRPHWQFHHMGLGEPIGFSTLVSQNNNNTYFASYFPRYVHMGLMGDPTLRMHIVAPPSNLSVTPVSSGRYLQLAWNASPDTVLGYYIYKADSLYGEFSRISDQAVTATSWVDSCPQIGDAVYMVRALDLQNGHSGTYFNLSQGIFGAGSTSGNLLVQVGVNMGPFCAGDPISTVYQVTGPLCPDNTFYLELSNSSGSFAAPDTIGTSTSPLATNLISGIIPQGTPAGMGYRIRVVTDSPEYIGNDNGSPFAINPLPVAGFSSSLSGNVLTLTNSSQNATSYLWNFGDGNADSVANPVHSFGNPGTFTVVLIALNDCGNDTIFETVTLVGLEEDLAVSALELFPNPSNGRVSFRAPGNAGEEGQLRLLSLEGRVLWEADLVAGTEGFRHEADLSHFANGIYLIEFKTAEIRYLARLVKEN